MLLSADDVFGENSSPYFRFFNAWWKCKGVEGFRTIADRIKRLGRISSAHNSAARELLSRLLQTSIEHKHVPSASDSDMRLFEN